jgi:oligopeptide/dipeptide ABC transporter ATP-binding protein
VSALLELERLRVELPVEGAMRPVIHELSLEIAPGEAVGLVGESGSGKSTTARSVMRLLPSGADISGGLRFDGVDLLGLDRRGLREFRAREVSMIFQDPRAHINPVRTIGDFLVEVLTTVRGERREAALARAEEMLRDVGITDASRRLRQHPHELSGGLLQRVMIAAALLAEPRLILADEPSTALDVTTQEEVMAILDEQRRERNVAMMFITHDLDLAAAVCDRIAVMYAGFIVEEGAASTLHAEARHPYTRALIAARPDSGARGEPLRAIPGRPLSAFEAPEGCAFATRCPHVGDVCRTTRPPLREFDGGLVACVRAAEIREGAAPAQAANGV